MARQQMVVTVITDDLTGDVLSADEVQTVSFAVDGTYYQIDLSPTHASTLRRDLGVWVARARAVTAPHTPTFIPASTPVGAPPRYRSGARRSRTGRTNADRERAATIRQWAVDTGYVVFERGRIPAAIVRAYEAQAPTRHR